MRWFPPCSWAQHNFALRMIAISTCEWIYNNSHVLVEQHTGGECVGKNLTERQKDIRKGKERQASDRCISSLRSSKRRNSARPHVAGPEKCHGRPSGADNTQDWRAQRLIWPVVKRPFCSHLAIFGMPAAFSAARWWTQREAESTRWITWRG